MYNQSFSQKELYHCITQSERRNLGIEKENLLSELDSKIVQPLNHGRYNFSFKQTNTEMVVNGKQKEDNAKLYQDIVLRKLHRNIVHIYNVKMSDRNQIVTQIKTLLSENVPLYIVRLDVRHFYESIKRQNLIDRIQNDCRLSPLSINSLMKIDKELTALGIDGLPQGISISAALSEMYMKYFDYDVKHIEGVYFYARFVDDIIVFCSNQVARDKVWNVVPKLLCDLGLRLNHRKSYKWEPNDGTRHPLTYLGYLFDKKGGKVSLTIAPSKLCMIKTRITRSFVSYAKTHDYDLLLNRVKFLTGNFMMYSHSSLAPIMAGIYFNYKQATESDCLHDLDAFYQRLLHCKTGKIGTRLTFTDEQMRQLKKYSFYFGFHNHVRHYFKSVEISNIKKCWK